MVSGRYFSWLGAAPRAGRVIGPDDDRAPDGAAVAVVSDAFWRSALASDPAILGRRFNVGRAAFEVVGVMPAAFSFPPPLIGAPVDFWAPIAEPIRFYRGRHYLNVVARLKPQVTLDQAMVVQRSEAPDLRLPDAPAGIGEGAQARFSGQLKVVSHQFARFIAAGVPKGPLDGGQFVRDQHLGLIRLQEAQQRFGGMDILQPQRLGGGAQRHQTLRRAELLHQRVPVAQQFRSFWMRLIEHRDRGLRCVVAFEGVRRIYRQEIFRPTGKRLSEKDFFARLARRLRARNGG